MTTRRRRVGLGPRRGRLKFLATWGALLLSSCLGQLAAPAAAGAQTLRPHEHPNHYIVLVDASGSTGENAAKQRLFERALGERLISRLYREGFGDAVPPYDPRQDRLTLHSFGVVTGDRATAYSRLRQHDLAADFIHPVRLRQVGVEADALRASLFPAQTYNYTILAWAKQLALHRSRPAPAGEASHRTFMIVVHDGLSNEGSPESEVETVRRHSPDNYQKVKPLVAAVDGDYLFTDGAGQTGPALAEELRDDARVDSGSIFLEAYEVTPAADAAWAAAGLRLEPLEDFRLEWTDDSGERPSGLLRARLGDEFAAWAGAAEASSVSLAARTEAGEASGAGLELPLTFSGPLTCDPRAFEGTLRVSLQRSDPLLGARLLDYARARTLHAPPPASCTVTFYAWWTLAALLAALALAALHHRFRGSHLVVEIPGTLRPIPLRRGAQLAGQAPVLPQDGLEALTLRLPGRTWQRLFYRKATVTLDAEGGGQPLGWAAPDGPPQVELPLPGRLLAAHWRRLPGGPTNVNVTFRQGRQRSQVRLSYPRSLTESFTRSALMSENRENRVYVALDLGSESMAAYFETPGGEGRMIKLQDVGKRLWRDAPREVFPDRFDLLQEGGTNGNGGDSPRLWNRISLKDGAQPREPEVGHAKLCFVTPPDAVDVSVYNQSLFRFFHPTGGWPPSGKVLPNPKIIFQQQVADVLKPIRIDATDGGRVRLQPEMLIKHLTLQVVVNFVLNSPELSDYDRRNIHLTITVPNVYSLPHAESIKAFVREHVGPLAGVEVLSESDAVAYYALKRRDLDRDSPDLLRFKKALFEEIEKRREVCIVTIDVGKGTTDLSCVLVQKPRPASASMLGRVLGRTPETTEDGERRRHSVQGKTGKSSGGNYLNYIFARYYDARLKAAAAGTPLQDDRPVPFGFIAQPPTSTAASLGDAQAYAVAALEKLIERVKRSMTEDYEIDERLLSVQEQREMLGRVVDHIIRGVDPNWGTALMRGDEADGPGARYEAFKANVVEALILPSRLEAPPERSFLSRLFARLGKFFKRSGTAAAAAPARPSGPADADAGAAPTSQTARLRRDIENYVRENVEELLDSLGKLVDDHQATSADRAKIDGGSFVIVSGQASQFRPLRSAIRRKCRGMGIGEEQTLMMEGVPSKEACCKGVVNFWVAEMLHVNPKELHGTYGCMDAAFGGFKPFDMKKIKNGRSDTLSFGERGAYYVIFTPRSQDEVLERPPEINDGATALIGVFTNESKFTIEYVPEDLELKVNGRPLTISSFGSVDGSIYRKVWPEILQPHGD